MHGNQVIVLEYMDLDPNLHLHLHLHPQVIVLEYINETGRDNCEVEAAEPGGGAGGGAEPRRVVAIKPANLVTEVPEPSTEP